MTPTDRLPGIHALRVVAAFTVFLLHVLNLTANFVEPVTRISGALDFGVPLFFAVSAFSLMYSTRPYQGTPRWVSRFYLKRFFRIAPLFYFMLVTETIMLSTISLGGFFPQKDWPDAFSIFLNVFFLFGLVPGYTPSMVLVGWSVGAEMLFYAMFPILLVYVRGIWPALAFVIFAQVIGEIARPILDPLAHYAFMVTLSDEHIIPNLRYFAFGILAFHVFDRLSGTRLAAPDAGVAIAAAFHATCALLAGALIALVVLYKSQLEATWHLEMPVWGALFAVLCVWFTVRPIRFFAWEPIQYLGERSYSLYLVHFPGLLLLAPFTGWAFNVLHPAMGDWALAVAVVATYLPIVLVSAITYRFIERPGMELGKRMTRRLGGSRPATQSVVGAGD